VPDALVEHRNALRAFVARGGVQTNEVQRSWVLLPGFLELSRRTGADTLDLIELGSSAGLNLYWDRYRHRYEAGEWGPADAPLSLSARERRPVPAALLRRTPRVRSRTGIDLEPIDVTTEAGARLLKSFVWADQHERLARLDCALAAVRDDPPRLVRGDYVELLPDLLARRADGALTVVFATATLNHLSQDERKRVHRTLGEAGADSPLAFLWTGRPRMDETAWGIRLVLWPGEVRVFLGHADYHGAWLEWDPA
jgi:hypothetical protein